MVHPQKSNEGKPNPFLPPNPPSSLPSEKLTQHPSLLTPQILFTSTEQTKRTDDHRIHLYSKRRIDIVVRLVLVLITVALLVGPSAVLFLVYGHSKLKICLILVFTLLFAAAISVCTKAKRHEMLAATAT